MRYNPLGFEDCRFATHLLNYHICSSVITQKEFVHAFYDIDTWVEIVLSNWRFLAAVMFGTNMALVSFSVLLGYCFSG